MDVGEDRRERQLETDQPRGLDLILKQQGPEAGSDEPARSLAVTCLEACKAKGPSLEGTRPGQRVRRSAGLGGTCAGLRSSGRTEMPPGLWHDAVSDPAELLKGKGRCNLPLSLFCSSGPLFKPTSSGPGGQALAAQGVQRRKVGCARAPDRSKVAHTLPLPGP